MNFVHAFFTEHFPATASDIRRKLRLPQSCTVVLWRHRDREPEDFSFREGRIQV